MDQNTRPLELFQPLGKHFGRNTGQIGAKRRKPQCAEHQFPYDQQRPPFADQFHSERRAAGVIIPPSMHIGIRPTRFSFFL